MVGDVNYGEWVRLDRAAQLAGVTPKHMRRIMVEAQGGYRTFWKGERLVWRGEGAGLEIRVSSLPLDARERFLIDTYHLNLDLPHHLALPAPMAAQDMTW
jgi:hypothetical protein